MTAPSSHRFVLVGALEGQTVHLGGHDFVDGIYSFLYIKDGIPVLPSNEDVTMKARYLARSFQAFPENSAELEQARAAFAELADGKEPKKRVPGAGNLDVRKREIEDEEQRSEATVSSRQAKTITREAILKLDFKNDEHWTDAGLPSVNAVRAIAGVETISRADIQALAPNLTREEAKKVAEGA